MGVEPKQNCADVVSAFGRPLYFDRSKVPTEPAQILSEISGVDRASLASVNPSRTQQELDLFLIRLNEVVGEAPFKDLKWDGEVSARPQALAKFIHNLLLFFSISNPSAPSKNLDSWRHVLQIVGMDPSEDLTMARLEVLQSVVAAKIREHMNKVFGEAFDENAATDLPEESSLRKLELRWQGLDTVFDFCRPSFRKKSHCGSLGIGPDVQGGT